jgi:phosphatidylethanolamine-binding protein
MSVLEKFISEGVVPDVIDEAPAKAVKVSYPSGAVPEGVELTPTQVKDEPKVEWESEDGSFYTVLLTGECHRL